MNKIIQKTFPVLNMNTSRCRQKVQKAIIALPGVDAVKVDLENNLVSITYDKKLLTVGEIRAAILSAGYDIIVDQEDQIAQQEKEQNIRYQKLRRDMIGTWVFAVPLLMLSVNRFFELLPSSAYLRMIMALLVLVLFGKGLYASAWKKMRKGIYGVDFLVGMSVSIAFVFSVFNTFFPEFWIEKNLPAPTYFGTMVMILAFVLTGKFLEVRTKSSSTLAIRNLMGLRPKHATILKDNEPKQILLKEIAEGDIVLINPADRVPIDGEVIDGASYVDESMLSGEPLPVEKAIGSKVTAGTVNQRGMLKVRTEAVGEDTFLAQIIRMVQEAQSSKAPNRRIVDRFTSFYLPIVVCIAIIAFVCWVVFGEEHVLATAFFVVISILIAACPCVLGLTTPMSLLVGVNKASNTHILIKDIFALERVPKIDTIVLDKTGTITKGTPGIVGWLWAVPQEDKFMRILLAAELKSDNPLALTLLEELSIKQKVKPIDLDSISTLPGKGVIAEYENQKYWVGGKRLKKEFGAAVTGPLVDILQNYEDKGYNVVFYGRENIILSIIAVTDPLKPTSVSAIKELARMGLQVTMLTGDSERTATALAHKLEIKSVKAEVLPHEKEAYIRELQSRNRNVAMVGDGINDSQALACADVSIAMGKGTDIAMNVAMITLMTSDLSLLPRLIRLSKRTVSLIRENLFWAFIFNILSLPIAAGILYPLNGMMLSPMILGAAMALSTLFVVLNSLSLDRGEI